MHRGAVLACLALLLVGACALRLTGLDWLLPAMIEPDAHIPLQVRAMEGTAGEDNAAQQRVDWGAYPHLVARLAHWFTPREQWGAAAADVALPEQLARAAWPVLRVRLIVALLSVLAVPAAWLLARLWLPDGWSLLAAGLMSTSLLALQFSGEARAHGAAVGLFALALLACVRLARRGDASSYLLAGAAVALVIACLQSGLATLIPLALAHLLASRGRGARGQMWLLVPAACVALAVVVFYPFVFQPSSGADAGRLALEEGAVLAQSGHQVFLTKFDGLGFLFLGRALRDWDPALAAGAGLALLLWLLARRRPSQLVAPPGARAVVLAFVLPYALVIGLYERSYERFLLPLVPFLAVFAAWGAARACELIRSRGARIAVAVLLVGGLLGFPTAVAVQLARARVAPDTLEVMADWIREHVAPGREPVVIGRSLSPPLLRTRAAMFADAKVRPDRGLGWTSYQRASLPGTQAQPAWQLLWMPFDSLDDLAADLAHGPRRWVSQLPADLVAGEVYSDASASSATAAMTVITAALRQSGQLLQRISPDADPQASEVKLAFQDESTGEVPPMAWRILHARSFGPVIEIYRITHEAGRGGPR